MFLSVLVSDGLSQGFNGLNQSMPQITAHFRSEDLIIEPEATLFNVLVIENLGDDQTEVQVEINTPVGWSLIAAETQNIFISPGDSVLIPVRAAPSKEVEGEIGYSIIAAINDRRGETLTNAYCFVKIPRKSDLVFRPVTRVSYFDQETGEAEISFRLSNRGNISELVYLTFQSTRNVELRNERENTLLKNVTVDARTDTIITLPVQMVEDHNIRNGSLFRIDLEGHTEEHSFRTSFWFSHLTNYYFNEIPESEKMLVAEVALQNLLSDQPAQVAGGVRGNILFPQDRDINYMFYRYGSGPLSEILQYSRAHVTYNSPRFQATVGDISGLQLKYGGGKGASLGYHFTENLQVTALANENLFRPIRNYGTIINERYSPLNLTGRYAYSENELFDLEAHLASIRGNLGIAPGHTIRWDIGASQTTYNAINSNKPGYGFNLEYRGQFENTTIRLRERFGSNDFYGRYAGRHNFTGRILHRLENDLQLELNINDQSYKPLVESSEGVTSDKYVDHSRASFVTRKIFDRGMVLFGGPLYERKSTNIFLFYDEQSPFATQSAKASLGARISDGEGLTVSPNITLGYTFVTDYSTPDPTIFPYNLEARSKNFFNSHISINLRQNFWGAFINYFYGPYSVNQEVSKFYYDLSAHSVRIMPYLERFIYRDMVKLSTRLSYLYDFAFETNRMNLNNQVDVFMRNDFTLSVLNTISYQVTTDQMTDESYRYSNNYVEVRLTKAFNWNQPRVQYHDLEVNLFKDLNGNLVRDPNEPGVKDILVSIRSIEPAQYHEHDVDYEPAGSMVSTQLLTGMDGTIRFDNLPRGLYRIELENIGTDQDKYFPDQNDFLINVTDDKTVYIPFLERNKIFGRAILNRSRLSTLGRIEVSNIKVTAVDSKGRETSTLTDANGYFEMYVPSVDNYTVSINNIFRDHFNLRQNNFRANLNGFKQFEVNFVFDEIRRQIEFTPSPEEIDTEIRRVGRTNLHGTVRDATTLQPVRAQIEIVDNTTGNTLQQTHSDHANGRFTTSFATGEDYMIVVSARGYWLHSERLILDQFLTIQDVERDILLENITVGARFQLNNLRFAAESYEIPTEALPELDRLINQLRRNPNVRIRIEGHSDAVETLENPDLSMQRAETVMKYMVQNGFSNIEFTGLKDSQPTAPNDTEENRRRNRRVEIIVIER